ncbi:hypothetical protein ACTQ33_08170 [Candidatus Avoscillospira sp. LCP25S3_F1]|uniref:hypothetical protein n=1 Tax=Candidatus Avoscillospira sp. LCP25S3_F1 TaxID=3438825 RepID=UPI003F926FFC
MRQYAGELFGSQVMIDLDATATWYHYAAPWGCDCGHCRNFLKLAQQKQLPSPVIKLLGQLQIPPEKATYVCELYSTDGEHLYQFCYRLAGQILSENDPHDVRVFHWGTGCCGHDPYPYGAPEFPEPQFDLIFSAQLPWVLEEPDQ